MQVGQDVVAELRGLGIRNTGTLTMTNSTVSENLAESAGGGIHNKLNGIVTLTDSTVSGNSAQTGRSIYSAGGQSRLTLTSSTVSAALGFGDSIYSVAQTVTARGILMRGGCDGALESGGGNLESPSNSCGFDQETDQHSVSAEALQLGPLADNGGATRTHALLPDSVAIDVIPESDCVDPTGEPLVTDQRGQPRPETGATMCDVGAFELQP